MRVLLTLIAVICLVLFSSAQQANDECLQALNLCPNVTYSASNIGATVDTCAGCEDGVNSAGNFCFELNNSVWFSFNTNSIGGNATVNITNLNCLVGAGNDDELQAVIIEAGVPCDESTYSSVSNCESNQSGNFALNAAGLLPNTSYYIQIDGDINGSTNPAECDFEIMVSGGAVTVVPTVLIQDETCGASDGEIDVTSFSGGQGPYTYSLNGGAPQANGTFSGLTMGNYDLVVQDANGCIYNIGTQQVNVTGGPTGGSPVVNDADCGVNNGQIDINLVAGGTPPYTYFLNGGVGQGSNSFTNLNAGTYEVVVEDANGCQQIISNIIISNTTGPTGATVFVTDATCGASDGEIAVNVNGGTPAYSYSLNGGASQFGSVFSNLPTGVYSIVVTDANGCTFEINNIEINELDGNVVPSVSITAVSNPACVGDQVTFTAVGINSGGAPTYVFYVNGIVQQTGPSDTFTGVFNDGDEVYCELISDDPCVIVNEVNSNLIVMQVFPNETPTVDISTPTTSVCSGDVVTITASETTCQSAANYEWFVNGISVASGPDNFIDISTLQNGATVTCEATCGSPCSSTSVSNSLVFSVTVVTADAGPDQQIIQGGSAILNGSASGSVSWDNANTLSDPTIENPIASPSITTEYILTVTQNGCTAMDTVLVEVSLPIVLPNTFTQNGDGTNDTWIIFRIESYPNCDVNIYDRWGQRIFHSIGYTNQKPWDGTNSGAFLPAATYYYVIDLRTGDKDLDIKTGSITIIY